MHPIRSCIASKILINHEFSSFFYVPDKPPLRQPFDRVQPKASKLRTYRFPNSSSNEKSKTCSDLGGSFKPMSRWSISNSNLVAPGVGLPSNAHAGVDRVIDRRRVFL